MNNSLVTVLMPVYNGQAYLKEAIDSILSQTYKNFEFLIINDGSTDDSVKIINSYQDKRIRLINLSYNQGIIAALNRGLEESKGEYIARMDSDDISLPNRLDLQVSFMEKNKNIGISGGAIKAFGATNAYWKRPKCHEEIMALMLFETGLFHPTVIMRSSIIKSNNLFYNKEFIHAEDYDFWINCSKHTRLANISQTLIYYRVHSGSIMRKYKEVNSTTVNKIRWLELTQLGLLPSEADLLIHNKISNFNYDGTIEFLLSSNSWLCKLVQQNIKKSIYDNSELKKIVLQRFFSICVKCADNGLKSTLSEWQKFLRYVNIGLGIVKSLKIIKRLIRHRVVYGRLNSLLGISDKAK
jgi:glycosyltransferase involved in cell wall biosynthesis